MHLEYVCIRKNGINDIHCHYNTLRTLMYTNANVLRVFSRNNGINDINAHINAKIGKDSLSRGASLDER